MRRTVIALALIASPATAQTNADIQWQANRLHRQVIDELCTPYTYEGQQHDMLIVYIKRRLPDPEMAMVAASICMAYTRGWTDQLLNRGREEAAGK